MVKYTTVHYYGLDINEYIEFYNEDGSLNGIKILLDKPLYKLGDDPISYGEMEKVVNPNVCTRYFIKTTNEFSDDVYIPVILNKIVDNPQHKGGGFGYYDITIEENGIVSIGHELYDIKQTILPPQPVFIIVKDPVVGQKYYFKLKDDNGEDFYFLHTYVSFENRKFKSPLPSIESDNLYYKNK
jgi:hypothetical protein